jgi:hypothetical protein
VLHEAGVITGVAYVDLKPIQANMGDIPVTPEHMSIHKNIESIK